MTASCHYCMVGSPNDIYCQYCGYPAFRLIGFNGSKGKIQDVFADSNDPKVNSYRFLAKIDFNRKEKDKTFFFHLVENSIKLSSYFEKSTCTIEDIDRRTGSFRISSTDGNSKDTSFDGTLRLIHPYFNAEGDFRFCKFPEATIILLDGKPKTKALGAQKDKQHLFDYSFYFRDQRTNNLSFEIPVRITTNQPTDFTFSAVNSHLNFLAVASEDDPFELKALKFEGKRGSVITDNAYAWDLVEQETKMGETARFYYLLKVQVNGDSVNLLNLGSDFSNPFFLDVSFNLESDHFRNYGQSKPVTKRIVLFSTPNILFENPIEKDLHISIRKDIKKSGGLECYFYQDIRHFDRETISYTFSGIIISTTTIRNAVEVSSQQKTFSPNVPVCQYDLTIALPRDVAETLETDIDLQFTLACLDHGQNEVALISSSIQFQALRPVKSLVAFDYGTTNTCGAFWNTKDKNPKLLVWFGSSLNDEDDGNQVDSKVILTDCATLDHFDSWHLGDDILEQKMKFNKDPELDGIFCYRDFKKQFQTKYNYNTLSEEMIPFADIRENKKDNHTSVSLEGILASFIRYAEKQNNIRISNAAFTFPTKWPISLIFKYKDILAQVAKTMNIRIEVPETDEGTAVLFHHFSKQSIEEKEKRKVYISYDLGGGTLDVTAIEMWFKPLINNIRTGVHCKLIGFSGNPDLGSSRFTQIAERMLREFLEELFADTTVHFELLSMASEIILQGLEGATPSLYTQENAEIHHKDFRSLGISLTIAKLGLEAQPDKLANISLKNSSIIRTVAELLKRSNFSLTVEEILNLLTVQVLFTKRGQDNLYCQLGLTSNPTILEIAKKIFKETERLNLRAFLKQKYEYRDQSGRVSMTVQKVFEQSLVDLVKILPESGNYEGLEVILAGNGCRFGFIYELFQEKLREILQEKSAIFNDEINIREPGDDAKKAACLGLARRSKFAGSNNIPPVFEVIHRTPFVEVVNEHQETDFFSIFPKFNRYVTGLFTNNPQFKTVKGIRFNKCLDDDDSQYLKVEIPIFLHEGEPFATILVDRESQETPIRTEEGLTWIEIEGELTFSMNPAKGFPLQVEMIFFGINGKDKISLPFSYQNNYNPSRLAQEILEVF